MGKTIRRINRSHSPKKEAKKKEKYKISDQYKGMSSEEIYGDEKYAENWYEFDLDK